MNFLNRKCLFCIGLLLFGLLLGSTIGIHAQEKIADLKPTTILISLDGFHPDYLEKFKPPILTRISQNGVRARWMTPSFPTKTFPNHYTIATGLYPEHHGIVSNDIYDPEFDAVFGLRKRSEVENPRWWWGEPIWVTAEKQGQIAGSYFFPGTETEINGVRPTYWHRYDGKVPNKERVDSVLAWLDLPVDRRPTFITMYFSDVDDAGHRFSPNSLETFNSVREVDSAISRLLSGLELRNIENAVNIVVVSDHGMIKTQPNDYIVLDEMFNQDDAIQVLWTREFVQIFPKPDKEAMIYESIKTKLGKHANVYLKSEIPSRFDYNEGRRIAPILVLADPGWRIVKSEWVEKQKEAGNGARRIGGSHGYDNEIPEMRSLFIARGPAFKIGYISEPFQNIEVYNILAKTLGLEPAKNDGDLSRVKDIFR